MVAKRTFRLTTLADAILDWLVHNAYKINLRGEPMRKQKAKLTSTETSEYEEKPRCAPMGGNI